MHLKKQVRGSRTHSVIAKLDARRPRPLGEPRLLPSKHSNGRGKLKQ